MLRANGIGPALPIADGKRCQRAKPPSTIGVDGLRGLAAARPGCAATVSNWKLTVEQGRRQARYHWGETVEQGPPFERVACGKLAS